MTKLSFDGRVAVVTGAGAGLGRAYALLFASRGAKVVVNDLGGGRHGDGKSFNAADKVVEEIKSNGGTAVADYNSVVEGEKIIETAMNNFGRVDILVNNAGILRDRSFARISDQDWDLIHAVHVKGSFKTTQAAFPIFKKQNYGRIIMTASNSGVYGNFGQANYSAAKLGLVGLANTVSIEGRKNNIHCNVIVPTAASRLTEDILPPDLFQELRPELIAPVVAYLCHESCEDTGAIIDSAVGWAAKVHMVRGEGSHLRNSIAEDVTIENVRDNWSKVVDMNNAKRVNSIEEATGGIMSNLQALQEGKTSAPPGVIIDEVLLCPRDFIVYALGIGASISNPTDLKYLYENHEDFIPLPTYFILPGINQSMSSNIIASALPPGKEANFSNILHGEQYIEIVGNLPQGECALTSRSFVTEVLDKGSGLIAIVDNELTDKNGNVVAKTQLSTFVVGAGGFGGPRKSTKAVECVPKPNRKADAVMEQKTSLDQAALYRLSGDINPLHIDQQMATISGFKKPILHGLCTLGFSARHVLAQYGNNDPNQMKCLKARFVKPVYPGQTLVTSMWVNGNRIHFETSVKETNDVVISGAFIDLKSGPKVVPQAAAMSGLKSDGVFARIQDGVKQQPDKAKSVNGVFLYNITSDGKQVKQWTLDLKTPAVYEGSPKSGKADTTLVISDDDMVDLSTGKLNPQVAFMKGKLKITGNIMLTQKLVPLLKADAKL
ncbi:peroxisomal multifunctional enzyme type 2-like isoform X1 [Arctopsyche grandis]|uniref:peroxisomal multifunctional enzyme type 2-like isoform X1 n=2 Tax=Arctopsyche grandis TaxID=121162 RepID=UPI00406D76A3